MTRTLAGRLTRLERAAGLDPDVDGDCPACRGRVEYGYAFTFDGVPTEHSRKPEPKLCPLCGRNVARWYVFDFVTAQPPPDGSKKHAGVDGAARQYLTEHDGGYAPQADGLHPTRRTDVRAGPASRA